MPKAGSRIVCSGSSSWFCCAVEVPVAVGVVEPFVKVDEDVLRGLVEDAGVAVEF